MPGRLHVRGFLESTRRRFCGLHARHSVFALTQAGRLTPLDPSYIVLAPRIVRPGMIYRVSVTLLKNDALQIRASLLQNGVSLDATQRDCQVGVTELLLLKVSFMFPGGVNVAVARLNSCGMRSEVGFPI